LIRLWIHPGDQRIVAFLSGGLKSPAHSQVQRHLLECARCQARLAALDEVLREWEFSRPPLPAGLLAAGRDFLAKSQPGGTALRRRQVAALVGQHFASDVSVQTLQPVLDSFLGRRNSSALIRRISVEASQ
jgi:hypothetical protein